MESEAIPPENLVQGLEHFSVRKPGPLDLSGACRDPKDDKSLACPVEDGVHCLVSSDRDLLEMRRYRIMRKVVPTRRAHQRCRL